MPSERSYDGNPDWRGAGQVGNALADLGEMPSVSPVDGRVMGWYAVTRPEDVLKERGHLTQQSHEWRSVPLRERVQAVHRLRVELERRSEPLARTLSQETGKPIVESFGAEVLGAVRALAWLEQNAGRVLKPVRLSSRRRQEWEPYGVIGLLTPWNYPLFLSLPSIATALVAGNTVLWKPSELGLASAHAIQEVVRAAGLGAQVRMVAGDYRVGEATVDADCDKYVLIGGVSTGRAVLEKLGRRLRPAVAELSGADPFIVLADADVCTAARAAVWARTVGAGQTCMAPKRIYVANSVVRPFVEECETRLRALRIGDPLSRETEVGPLRTEELRQTADELVDDAVSKDAHLAWGGRPVPSPGFYWQPALLTDCHAATRVMQEDVFAPILAICPISSPGEAIALANESPFGLTASVWTTDARQGMAIARELRGGVRCVNDVLLPAAEPDTPFGGSGQSGFGRVRGVAGLMEMVQPVVYDSGPRAWEPRMNLEPYQPATLDIVRAAIQLAGQRGAGRLKGAAAMLKAISRYRR